MFNLFGSGRIGLFGALVVSLISLSGCLTRPGGPTMPYIRPAQSVPAVDPIPLRLSSRLQDMEVEMQRLKEMIERLQAAGGNQKRNQESSGKGQHHRATTWNRASQGSGRYKCSSASSTYKSPHPGAAANNGTRSGQPANSGSSIGPTRPC